jgi:hypothetical protein
MKKAIVALLFLSCFSGNAQLKKNVEIEVVGRPSWQMSIPMAEDGLIFLVKTDITKMAVFRFDSELNKLWEKEVFLDAEEPPKAYTIAKDHISLMFSETSGMYYQVFEFNLDNGELAQSGFELREFFVDQDYVFLDDKVVMAGYNEKGAAYFIHNFLSDQGKLEEQPEITGKVAVNLFEYVSEKNEIESVWAVKTMGYSNEKKKKGEFVKDAFVVYADLDTTGKVINKTIIKQSGGKFPLNGRLLRMANGRKVVMGTYQSNTGDKGIYYYDLSVGGQIKTYSYTSLFKGNNSLSVKDLEALLSSYEFMINDPLEGEDKIIFGGVFIRAQFQSVTEQNPNYDPYRNGGYGRPYGNGRYGYSGMQSRTTTREVFRGYHYPVGFVMELETDGELITVNRIDINNLSNQMQPTLAYNKKGAVSYCLKGDLATNNFNIGNRPMLYKLSEDDKRNIIDVQTLSSIPSYNGVKFWYNNYFIAEGSRSKIEAISINDKAGSSAKPARRGLFGKKQQKTPASYSQIRKTIYLTKIASGA